MNIFQLVYLMIPAYISNMIPVFTRGLPWNAPIDFGLKFGSKRLLGENKTWAGFVSGLFAALISGVLISQIYWPFAFSALRWSFLAGFGALFGDIVKSFFKRRVGIKPGKPWIPFDQIDYSVGALAFGSFVFFPGWLSAFWLVIISLAGHIIVNHCAYYFGIRDTKW